MFGLRMHQIIIFILKINHQKSIYYQKFKLINIMDAIQLGKLLADSYKNAQKGEKVMMIHLFGIKYSEELLKAGVSEVIKESGIYSTYTTELGKGIKLARFVKPI
jgi:hypothetical protein